MRDIVALLRIAAPLAISVAAIDVASAASPAYCALYAREYGRLGSQSPDNAEPVLQRLQDQAYYRCLNQDEDPQFPTTSAYFGAAVQDIAPVEPAPVAKSKPKPKKLAFRRSGRGSGLTPWTAEWVTWCGAHYRSFNATTGFVLTLSRERKLCP